MAKSGGFEKSFSGGFTLLVEWSESGIDTTNNQSDLTVTAKLRVASGYSITSSASKNIALTINGTKYTGICTVGISSGSTKTLMTKTVSNITHGSDGSKSVSISCILNIAVTLNGSYVSSVTASGTAALTKIARKSILSVNDGTLDTAQTLTITEQDSTFKHKLKYECGTASGWILGGSDTFSASNNIRWTPPLSLANQNTTGTSVSVKFILYTYTSNGTLIGSNVYTKKFFIPTTVKPSCAIAVHDAMGYADIYGGFVKGKSKCKVVVEPTTAYGSTITSYSTTANGDTYTDSEFTTGILKYSGKLTVSATVKDKRGRSGTASVEKDVLDYADPKISKISAKRCDVDGKSSNSGAYLAVTFSSAVTALNNKNKAEYSIRYKKKGDTVYTTEVMADFINDYAVIDGMYVFPAETGSTYDIILTVIDAFESEERGTTGSSISKVWSIFAKGRGIAFGKIAELIDTFDVAFNTIFRKKVTFEDTVTIQGDLVVENEWTPLTLEDNFVTYNNNAANQPKYKVTGNTVVIKGIVSPKTAVPGGSTWVTFARGLPKEICPDISLTSVCQGSGINRWALNVDSNGNLSIGRYGTTSFVDVPTSAWLPFCFTYQI